VVVMMAARGDLQDDGDHEHRGEDGRGHQVAEVHGHRDRVAAGLAERGGGDLHHPEDEGDFRNLVAVGAAACLHARWNNCRCCDYSIP
jgi:hypothetical protein